MSGWLKGKALSLYLKTKPGESLSKAAGGNWFTWRRLSWDEPANTAHSGPAQLHPEEARHLNRLETVRIQSFPDDYNFLKQSPRYVCGMSVPPLMMQRVADQIAQNYFVKKEHQNMQKDFPPLITGPWTLADLRAGKIGSPKNGLKVFSCFACGGGSTMGYKLAGYDVLGYCEIDPEMADIYDANHNPKLRYRMPVQEFKNLPDDQLHPDLFNLDILDGSPPCSSFSMAGAREKKWGKETHFREGQAVQVLDDLFFHFIDIAKRLQPKVVVAENVKGLILGNAKGYVKEIFRRFKEAGYECQLFLLNAARMGVPQARERTFFVARKMNDRGKPLSLSFSEREITLGEAIFGCSVPERPERVAPAFLKFWKVAKLGESIGSAAKVKNKWFGYMKANPAKPSNTLASAGSDKFYHWLAYRALYASEWLRLQSFPEDFLFLSDEEKKKKYLLGMSVPPLMMQRVADQIARQWFGSA